MKTVFLSKILKGILPFFFLGIFSSQAWALKVGLILDKGGRDDKSFNTASYEGSQKAVKDFKIELKVVEATDDNSFEPLIRAFASRNFDLVVCIGFSQADALKKVAPQYPKQQFAIIDSEVDLPNVRSILFEEHQGSFLIGAIAALKSKTGKVGFIGGMDIPLIRKFQIGYEAGAKHVLPKAKVTNNYLGFTSEAWNNPPKAKELATAQYNSGIDIIYVTAGASNLGVFDAAEEKKKLAIGVDSNQNWIKPGFILTSMLKRVDLAVYQAIGDKKEGKFTPGLLRLGLSNGGVDYSLDEHNKKLLTEDILKKVNQIKADIISGKIIVPDYSKAVAASK